MTEPKREAEGMAAGLAELWRRFHPTLVERVSTLEEAVVALLQGELGAGQRREAERAAHKLAGSMGTFGFPEASRHARSVELLLEGAGPLEEGDVLRLSEWALALRAVLEGSPSLSASVPLPDRPAVLVQSPDEDFAERVGMEASARGLQTRRTRDGSGTRASLADGAAPAAVVLDLAAEDRADGGDRFALLEEIASAPAAPPVVVVSERDGFADRVEAARRGGRAFLRRPASPVEVVDAVERMLLRRSSAGARLLVMDDDPQIHRLLEALLGGRGMEVHPVEDPALFWRELGRVIPDLVVLDMDMPGLDGTDLCRTLRSDPRWSTLPVLFLTARSDAASLHAFFAAGADDYVAKPVVGPELLTRIENRLERSRLSGAAWADHGPAGLPGREIAHDHLTRMLHLARRVGETVVAARVDVDAMDRIHTLLGPAAGDEALRRVALLLQSRLPEGDLVGWWGGERFAAALFASDRDSALQLLAEVLEDVGRERTSTPEGELRVTFSAGVACFPGDAGDAAGLLAAAEHALSHAREAGGQRILGYSADAGVHPADVVDVALVEDDAVVAELLLHTLEVQGYSARWLRDGDEAVAALGGRTPPLRARVVLLDVDLPGRDGLTVLRALARDRVVERSRVIMLTVRSSEREVLMALELGAADHVAKPFSVPVLVRRVRSQLERGG